MNLKSKAISEIRSTIKTLTHHPEFADRIEGLQVLLAELEAEQGSKGVPTEHEIKQAAKAIASVIIPISELESQIHQQLAFDGAQWAISQMQPEWEWNVIDLDNQETFPLEEDPVLCFTVDGLQLLQLTKYGINVVSWEWTTCFSKPINKSFPIDFVSQWKNVNEPPTK